MSGQLADAALVSASRWPPAAPVSVRGYLSAEATGDYGIWAPPNGARQLTYFSGLENWRLYAFADGARLRLRDPMIEQKDLFSLASVGVGSSFQFLRYLTGRVDFPTRCARGRARTSTCGASISTCRPAIDGPAQQHCTFLDFSSENHCHATFSFPAHDPGRARTRPGARLVAARLGLPQAVTVDAGPQGGAVGGDPGRTPVLLRLHSGNFNFEGVSDSGADLRFVAGDDKTVLNHQIEQFDPLLGIALIWVDVPAVTAGAPQQLWMYYGNPKAPASGNGQRTFDPDYTLVYHFAEANVPSRDSTAYGNNARPPCRHWTAP
jgi:hypothetical protein